MSDVSRKYAVSTQGMAATIAKAQADAKLHVADVIAYGAAGLAGSQAPFDKFRQFTNADLVMEMLKRGFVVMKAPGDGSFPSALVDAPTNTQG